MTVTDPARSDAALERYAAGLRRRRVRYTAAVTGALVLLAVFVGVVWSRGEIANTTLRTVSRAPANLALTTASATQRVVWQTGDRAALGTPQWQGTVVVWSKHTVRGLDARTGAQTWSYTRSNRTACEAVQVSGTTFAVFMVNGNCDEVTALDSGLGTRRWTRTLDGDGLPVNGRPAISVQPYTVMFATSSVIYAVDPSSGYNRWTYAITGCTIERAVLGTAGVLISQTCSAPKCSGQRYCAKGPQLLLRDASAGRDDKDEANPDKILWGLRGDTRIPVSADTVVSALTPSTGVLDLLDGARGTTTGQLALPARAGSPDVVAQAADTAELLYLHGVVYAVTNGRDTPLWTLTSPTEPVLVDGTGQSDPSLTAARITVGTSGGIAEIDGVSGRIVRTVPVPAPGAGSTVRPLGSGYLVSGPSGTIAYR